MSRPLDPGFRRQVPGAAIAAGAREPLRSATARLGCVAGVFLCALTLYTLTLAPTVTLVDSGELIVAARTLGVAHPPGFPLYVLLAHLATLVPVGNVAVRVNFASALFAALAAAVLAAVCAEILLGLTSQSRQGKGVKTPPRRASPNHDDSRPLGAALAWLPVTVGALLVVFSNTLWSYATVAEVYTLNTLLIAIVFLLMLRWRRGRPLGFPPLLPTPATGEGQGGGHLLSSRSDMQLYIAALMFGLALGVHHVTVGLTLPAIAVLVYVTDSQVFRSRRLLFAALCALAGLTIYAYLPLAAARAPVLNWGDPRTAQRLWWHVTGRQFQAYFSLAPDRIGAQLATFAQLALREFGPPWLPAGLALSLAGFATLFRRDRTMFWFLALVVAADAAYASSYEIAEDKAAYYLPAFVAMALAGGCGARWLLELASGMRARHATHATAAALLLVPLVALAGNFPFNNHRRDFIAHDYVDNILDTVEPGGLLLTLDWQVCSPMLYVRTIEQRRRDVVLIDANLLRRSWYFEYLRREYPEVMAQARDEVDAFLEDLRHWEQDPDAYQRDATLNQRIDSRFAAMMLAFVGKHLRAAPVYVTQEVVLGTDMQNSRWAKGLTAAYQLVPQGLVFQLFSDRSFHEPAAPALRTRSLTDGGLKFEPDDVVPLKVLPVYASMLYNRGRYLSLYGRHEAAIQAFKQALALDPGFVPAQRSLAESH